MEYTINQLKEMQELQQDRIKDLEQMLHRGRIGGYNSIEEVRKAFSFERSELLKIEKAMKDKGVMFFN